ncbi:ribosomal large subunit pseudouridine synthase D [Litorimonas taeanensis]|uniref:Pseudouridine synthase n=1 Tax=Litorimonas taeanensis TaxID=568099 RepID=A0A420WJT9_9PROT|nr:ribosomal large subunit pseudouridine synthase D [Litorimonas taeanensis]
MERPTPISPDRERWQTREAEPDEVGERLDKWLSNWTGLSRSRVKTLMENNHVRVDGDIQTNATHKVKPDIEYAILVPPPVDDTPTPENIPLDILYEDDQLIVVNKPSGMTVHPAPGSRSATLVNALLYHCKDTLSGIGGVMRPGIVHRLDKDTSGVLVVAKTDRAHRYLSKQFAKHTIERVYTLYVRGAPKPRTGRIESRLARSPHDRKKQAIVRGTLGDMDFSEHGRHAVTHYEYIRGFGQQSNAAIGTPKVSHIECRLETGRTHQIRVHMAAIHCPLLGDPLYGKQSGFLTANKPDEAALRESILKFKRQALHARLLGFLHPITKELMVFEADIPQDMKHLESALMGLETP